MKIAFIAADSVGFTRKPAAGIFTAPELREIEICFKHIDASNPELIFNV
jgi:alpha-galactosidase/6-phospho-beta-glucosidase family protein